MISLLSTLVCGLVCGCFYDSHGANSAAAQRGMTAETRPRQEAPAERRTAARTMKVRALVTRSFTAAVADAPLYIRMLMDDANEVLVPALGIRLEVDNTRTWDVPSENVLEEVVADASEAEPGDDVDWVVVFTGTVPVASATFHGVGAGTLLGKHLAVRGLTVDEQATGRYTEFEKSYGQPSDADRRGLHKDIRRHRATAVFLHEIGHTLGVVHETNQDSLMHRTYSPKAKAFSPEAIALMKTALERRAPKRTAADTAGLLRELAAALKRAPEGVFREDERTRTIRLYEILAAKTEKSATQQTAPAAVNVPDTPELSADDRTRFVTAFEQAARGDNAAAWETAKPLFGPYPSSTAVQELRCKVAMHVMPYAAGRKECEKVIQPPK